MYPLAPPSSLCAVYGVEPGFLKVHGVLPSTPAVMLYPALRAAARTIGLNDDPGWRPGPSVAMRYWLLSKPCPPTMARTAPVWVSTDTSVDVQVPLLSGRLSATACLASASRSGSRVV